MVRARNWRAGGLPHESDKANERRVVQSDNLLRRKATCDRWAAVDDDLSHKRPLASKLPTRFFTVLPCSFSSFDFLLVQKEPNFLEFWKSEPKIRENASWNFSKKYEDYNNNHASSKLNFKNLIKN